MPPHADCWGRMVMTSVTISALTVSLGSRNWIGCENIPSRVCQRFCEAGWQGTPIAVEQVRLCDDARHDG